MNKSSDRLKRPEVLTELAIEKRLPYCFTGHSSQERLTVQCDDTFIKTIQEVVKEIEARIRDYEPRVTGEVVALTALRDFLLKKIEK